jgi:hypothetical protein
MSNLAWSLVETFSQLLDHDEREAVRGDLAEAGEGAWPALLDVLGLVDSAGRPSLVGGLTRMGIRYQGRPRSQRPADCRA